MPSSETDRQPPATDGAKALLSSWKEIATHLQVSVKTAQRFESELGLPVKRLGGRVSISLAELTYWQERNTKANPWWTNVMTLQIGLAISGVLAAVGLFGAAGYYLSQRPDVPASLHLDGSLAIMRDRKGRQVWQHQFDPPIFRQEQSARISSSITDLDGDGKLDTVLVWQHIHRDSTGWGLHCISPDGTVRWFLNLEDKINTASGKKVGPPFVIRDYTLFGSPENDGTQWTAAVFVHVNDVISALVVVDSQGKRRGIYWHTGHLEAVRMFDANRDGKPEIVAGGMRHGVEQAVLVAFDPSRVSGANTIPANHPRAILNQGPSSEKWTAFIARSQLTRQLGTINWVAVLNLVNGHLQAHVYESIQMREGTLIYEFLPGLRVHDITMSAAFLEGSRRLQMREKLDMLMPEKELARLRREYRVEPAR